MRSKMFIVVKKNDVFKAVIVAKIRYISLR